MGYCRLGPNLPNEPLRYDLSIVVLGRVKNENSSNAALLAAEHPAEGLQPDCLVGLQHTVAILWNTA